MLFYGLTFDGKTDSIAIVKMTKTYIMKGEK